jgi:hypothetical protein
VSFPRRQQHRHTAHAAAFVVFAALAAVLALESLSRGHGQLALLLGVTAGGLGLAGRRSLNLAGRNRVGADSEAQVRHKLAGLRDDAWEVRHSVTWPGGGDIDHLLRSPTGVGFAVETKTRNFDERHLQRTVQAAGWAAGKRRRYPRGVQAVLCVVQSHGVEQYQGEVLVVSLDRLVTVLLAQGG